LSDWTPERGLLAAVATQALQDALAADNEALDYLAWWLDVDTNRLAAALGGYDKCFKSQLMSRLRNS
jgi:hypothetical protein